jgi:hypothetical protein
MSSIVEPSITLQTIPRELQLNLLTYLRAYDLSAVQQTCRLYNEPDLIDSLVHYVADHVYSPQYTKNIAKPEKGKEQTKYTLEHLRSIELTVVARVLSLPEPKQGFYISKAWIKKTLLWLETVNEPHSKKNLNKKQQRQRARRLSDISPPWPNANSDILCCHQNLQRCGAKAARSRRRLMDKQAWKILQKLYPDSTQLDSVGGECLPCLMETETSRKNEQDRFEKEKLQRKQPLANPLVRRVYTRTRGVPTDCLVSDASDTNNTSTSEKGCPLKSGTYVIILRAWCHQWRHYMKTGEGSMPVPPDSSALLCDAHKYALLPPHLEHFLDGSTPQLLSTIKVSSPYDTVQIPPPSPGTPASIFTTLPVGVQPSLDLETLNALVAAGFSQTEVAAQRMAMLQLQQEQRQAPATPTAARFDTLTSLNDMLDRENHVVVELVTEDEWAALRETGCWPIQLDFAVRVTVQDNQKFHFSTHPCRECDPTGSRFLACAEVKYRRKRWEPKSVEQKRIPRVEY